MARRGVWWSGGFLALALLAVTTMMVDHPAVSFTLRFSLITFALAGFWALSPTRILLGSPHRTHDLLITLLAAGVSATGIIRILDLPYTLLASRSILPIAFSALVIAAVAISRTQSSRQGGIIWALRVRAKGVAQDLTCVFGMFFLIVMILQPFLLFARLIAHSPLLISVFAVLFALVAWRGMPYVAHYPVLTGPDGVILAFAGALCVRFAIETIPQVILALPNVLPTTTIAASITILSAFGLITLALLPFVMWRSLLLLRSTRDARYVPSWSPGLVSATIGLLSIALFAPLVHPTWTMDGSGIVLGFAAPATSSLVPLLGLVLVTLVCGAVAFFSDRARRLLMSIPFLAGTLALAGFAVYAFLSAFLVGGAGVLLALSNTWYPFLVTQMFLVGIECLALLLGLCGFVYELVRD